MSKAPTITETTETPHDIIVRMRTVAKRTTDPKGRWSLVFDEANDCYAVVASNGVVVADGFINVADASFMIWARDHVAPLFDGQIKLPGTRKPSFAEAEEEGE